jgi:hypothetical protein
VRASRHALRGSTSRALLRLPAGAQLLDAARRSLRGSRRLALLARHPLARRRDVRPAAWKDHDWTVIATRVPDPDPYLSTNVLAGECRYIFRYDGELIVNEGRDNNWYFCRTDDAEYFLGSHLPRDEFVLLSGHSDRPVDARYRRYLGRPQLAAWFAVDALLDHPKLKPRPIGVVSPCWPNGSTATLRTVRRVGQPKSRLLNASFKIENNPREREYCLAQTGVPLLEQLPWPEYIRELASSYFCLSPKGYGIDCCRTWEALVVGTIPVVTRSLVTDHHRDYPMIVLNDWSEFRDIEFSPALYDELWGEWDPDELLLERYLARMHAILARPGDGRRPAALEASASR